MTSLCQIEHLFEHPQQIDGVAQWIYDEFWADKTVHSPSSLAALLRLAARPNAIPQSLLALVDGVPVGTVNLIENDDDKRAHLSPWLAALFVVPAYRRRGVGSALVRELLHAAAGLGIETLYLGTDNPAFYTPLGATIHEQVDRNFAIMQMSCSRASHPRPQSARRATSVHAICDVSQAAGLCGHTFRDTNV
jgi:predicted N-acetyltransferase YhbS